MYKWKFNFYINGNLKLEKMEKLGKCLKDELINLIQYLNSYNRKYLTSSDVHDIINQQYLNKLQQNKEIENVYLANSLPTRVCFTLFKTR